MSEAKQNREPISGKHNDEHWMRVALSYARRGPRSVAPNPYVGAVVVRSNKLISKGRHKGPGTPHAEVAALLKARKKAKGATIYVTLEPCCHWGSTPPCTKAIIEAGIKRVVYAQTDPNPIVRACDSRATLSDAGVEVVGGVLDGRAGELNRYYNYSILTGLPYVTLKLGLTIDGMIADRYGTSKWITHELSRQQVQRLRKEHDAVLVGIGTVLADDPQLTLHNDDGFFPSRIVLDPNLETPTTARLLGAPGRTIIITQKMFLGTDRAKSLANMGAELVGLVLKDGTFDVALLLKELAGRGVWSVLVEGGGGVAHAFERSGLVCRYVMFHAPMIVADTKAKNGFSGEWDRRLPDVQALSLVSVRRLADDVILIYEPKKLR